MICSWVAWVALEKWNAMREASMAVIISNVLHFKLWIGWKWNWCCQTKNLGVERKITNVSVSIISRNAKIHCSGGIHSSWRFATDRNTETVPLSPMECLVSIFLTCVANHTKIVPLIENFYITAKASDTCQRKMSPHERFLQICGSTLLEAWLTWLQ